MTPPGQPRFPLLDGLRAAAALMVLVTHASGLTGFNQANPLGALTARLDVGVTVFFVLSGFLLLRPFAAARHERRPRPSLRRYLRARVLRIVPGYWLALTVLGLTLGLPFLWDGPWWTAYTFTMNLRPEWIFVGIGPAWSLCVEAGFYLVLPLYAVLTDRWRPSVRAELALLAALGLASIALRTVAFPRGSATTIANQLPGTFAWFALGMGLAVLSAAGARPRWVVRSAWPCWAAAGVVLVVLARIGLPRDFVTPFTAAGWLAEHVGYGLFALLLVLPAVFGPVRPARGDLPRRLLGSPPVRRLALVSYGLFLWHEPIARELVDRGLGSVPLAFPVVTLAVLALSLACASVSWVLVEKPALRLKDPRRAAGRAGPAGRSAPAPGPPEPAARA